jgi:5-methylcytosine-specific restriction enzyme subunit McrC
MNRLFERFVISAFQKAQEIVPGISVAGHASHDLELAAIRINPDLTLEGPNNSIVAADAKYKRTKRTAAKHPDLYQVIAYCVALGLIGQ